MPIDQTLAHLMFGLLEAPVLDALEHQHAQHHFARRARAPAAAAVRVAPGQFLHHRVHQCLIGEDLVQPPKRWFDQPLD